MYDRTLLLKDCQGLVKRLEKDIRERTTSDPELAAAASKRYQEAIAAKKTAMAEGAWLSEQVTQAAVAWALGTVFVRFCEDNGLIDQAWIAGPVEDDATKNRFRQSELAREAYIVEHPTHTDVQYLHASFRALGAYPATKDLFAADRNPLWTLPVSAQGARSILGFWRELDRDGALVRVLRIDDIGDTRWLGDLYQEMSADARDRYALLQTPDFVEEFILDYTLTPAIKTFGIKGLRCIDPTCGSGHFLLGILKRLIAAWEQELGPTGSRKEAVSRAMQSVYGIDLNPFAVAISRFRLMLAGLSACGWKRLKDAPAFGFSLAVGNTLTYGGERGIGMQTTVGGEYAGEVGSFLVPGDYQAAKDILSKGYHVVVGNPPYITVKDSAEKALIKKNFPNSCSGRWSLSAPFTERFFNLAQPTDDSTRPAGYVGLINSNSFAKREYGRKLVELVLPSLHLTHVLDTSGCYVDVGHGTPTLILFGRNQAPPVHALVRAVLGKRGEPRPYPVNGSDGKVWKAMVENLGNPGAETPWLSVADVQRRVFGQHPWSLGGGGASELKTLVEGEFKTIADFTDSVGITSFTLEDDVYVVPWHLIKRKRITHAREMVLGDSVRDWTVERCDPAIFPYSDEFSPIVDDRKTPALHYLEPYRVIIGNNILFGGTTKVATGMKWYEYGRLTSHKLKTPLTITFAFKANYNHFVLCRGGTVFNRTSPVIKLPINGTEDDHLALIACLNSSTIAFYSRQICQTTGGPGGGKISSEAYMNFFELNAANVEDFPISTNCRSVSIPISRRLDTLGQELAALQPSRQFVNKVPSRNLLDETTSRILTIRSEMLFLQEELDWLIYHAYGILTEAECPLYTAGTIPLILGERAFEIELARKAAADEDEKTSWFERHRSTPITAIPTHWPASYQHVVQRRRDLIASHPHIGLLETPEHKRRWQTDPWDKVVEAGLYEWLCDQLEDGSIWPDEARLTSAQELADRLFAKSDVLETAALYRGNDIFDRVKLVEDLLEKESVPYIPALRYTEEGMLKRVDWESVWELQRREDGGEQVGNIPLPPKYDKTDFRKGPFWDNRGKLDVPKERFISYPGAEREPDTSTLVLWAGYDHAQQAKALIEHYQWAKSTAGWDAARLIPVLVKRIPDSGG